MYQYKAKILKWIDGDTVQVRIDLGFHCDRIERIRLARINAWELKDKSSYKRRGAAHVRLKAKKLCPEGSDVIVNTMKNPKQDMYARYIAEVTFKEKNISDELLKLKKGVEKFEN